MSNTKTISARVPLDVYKMVENTCKHKGLNKNQLITELITQAPSKPRVNVSDNDIPDELKAVLSGVGGLGAGALIYNVLDTYLPEERFKDKQSKQEIAFFCAVAVGIGATMGLFSLMKGK